MAIAPVPAFPFPRRPFSSITPFTYSDAMTHLELLEKLRVYAGVILPAEINKVLDEYSIELTAEVQAAIDLMIGTLNDKIIEINDALADQQADYTQKISDLTVYVDDAVQQIINNSIEVQDPVVASLIGDGVSETYAANRWQTERAVSESAAEVGGLWALIGARDTSAANMGFLGSSTTMRGPEAGGWVDNFLAMLCAAHPRSVRPHSNSHVRLEDVSGRNWFDSRYYGFNAINGAVGGSVSWGYADETTGEALHDARVSVIFHMVGSNDFKNQLSPETYRANIARKIGEINSAYTSSLIPRHILIHSFERDEVDGEYTWDMYGNALKQVSKELPNVGFIDVSPEFGSAMVGGGRNNQWGMLAADGVHATPDGGKMLAESIARKLGVAYSSQKLNQLPAGATENAIVSHRFQGNATLAGLTANNANGGSLALDWIDVDGGWAVSGGVLTNNAASPGGPTFAGLNPTTGDLAVSVEIESVPTLEVWLCVNRPTEESGLSREWGLRIRPSELVLYYRLNDDAQRYSMSAPVPYSAGDVVKVVRHKGNVYLYVNGAEKRAVNLAAWGGAAVYLGGRVGFYRPFVGSGDSAGGYRSITISRVA